ncbi:hypothetical protein BGZ63DRAFT_498984 [Mariannaea sp. PMI_226]|nr:hypothetical protein BGZ63DRAFT_498984 [Mariannaea sp. PMI_226]
MCFGRKDEHNDDPPPRPAQRPPMSTEVKRISSMPQNPGRSSRVASYAPPAGPPPEKRQEEEFSAPPGPPPGLSSQEQQYLPPMGPPPGQQQQQQYDPPTGPPPGQQQYAPPHDWEIAVPDTSLFPPPPAIFSGYDRSPTSNATEEEAEAGEEWCEQYPLAAPLVLDQAARDALHTGNIRLMQPVGFNGNLSWLRPGQWDAYTAKNSPDRCIIGYPPMYTVSEHDPHRTGQPKTIYYEVQIRPDSPTVFLALGFTALPYPSFRMPGWHRGSLAVHGDDGHKYINDRWGGKDFTAEFQRGHTYGIGMTFRAVGGGKPQVDIFFTHNGVLTGGWALHEETDAEQDLPVTGLEGLHDLSCAIGTYDGVRFEVNLDASKWLYNPFQV